MKNVLITGMNRGLGLGFSKYYLEQGCRVFATSRNPSDCTELANLETEFGDKLSFVQLDLTDEASIAVVTTELSGVEFDLVINNAGLLLDETLGNWTAETFARILQVNTIGPALLAGPCLLYTSDAADDRPRV